MREARDHLLSGRGNVIQEIRQDSSKQATLYLYICILSCILLYSCFSVFHRDKDTSPSMPAIGNNVRFSSKILAPDVLERTKESRISGSGQS